MIKLRVYVPAGVSLDAALCGCQSAARFFVEWQIEVHSEGGDFEPTIVQTPQARPYSGPRTYSVTNR